MNFSTSAQQQAKTRIRRLIAEMGCAVLGDELEDVGSRRRRGAQAAHEQRGRQQPPDMWCKFVFRVDSAIGNSHGVEFDIVMLQKYFNG